MANDERWMVIGQVAGPFGVRGEAKIEVLTDYPERFARTERVFVGPRREEYSVESVRPHGGQMLVRLGGIAAPEAVDKLRGQEVAIPREEATQLPDGHYYLEDLIGLEVETTEGEPVGVVRDVIRTGSNDVYVVYRGQEEVLVPAIRDAVTEVDVPAGKIVIQPWVLIPPE